MARLNFPECLPVYAAAESWKERCLVAGDSLFSAGRPIWGDATLADFHRRFVENTDEGSRSFLEKIAVQLDGSPVDTRRLAVELLYLHFVVVDSVTPARKREILHAVAEGAQEAITVPEEFDRALDKGLASGGLSFNTGRFWQVVQILEFVLRFRRQDAETQARLLDDPWAFKDFLYTDPVKFAPVQRNALLHLIFPDDFEPILSGSWKKKILEAFSDRVSGEYEDNDRRIAEIRASLATEFGDDFYFWQPEVAPLWLERDPIGGTERKDLPTPRLIESFLPDRQSRRVALSLLASSIHHAHEQGTECWGVTIRPQQLRLNVGRMQALLLRGGAVRVVVDRTALDEATLTTLDGYRDHKSVYRSYEEAIDLVFPAAELVDHLDQIRTAHYRLIEGAASRVGVTPYARHHSDEVLEYLEKEIGSPLPRRGGGARSLAELARDLFLAEDSLEAIRSSLEDRGQVILTGPPGTGKTFVARKLARWLAGEDGSVTTVQFHPSYSYEDFVEGFRPVLQGGRAAFSLRDGPLKRAADQARSAPDAIHVLLVDEINRGNLAKIFGELYYLLEYREDELLLQYSQTAFSLPRNLWLIGTMNTADRSIALVDLALRRRFHFHEFAPDRDPVKGVLRRWLGAHAPEQEWIADLLDEANRRLGDRHVAIGPSYFMREDIEEQLPAVWEHAVMPYLAEHFFGEEDRLRDFSLEALQASLEQKDGAA